MLPPVLLPPSLLLFRRAVIGFLALAVLTGCAQHFVWERPATTAADLRRDDYECERDIRQSMPQVYPGLAILVGQPQRDADRFYQRCMEARGWRRVE